MRSNRTTLRGPARKRTSLASPDTWGPVAAGVLIAVLIGVLATACTKTTPGAGASSAPASSAQAAASAFKTSQAGRDTRAEAGQLAAACKGRLGGQGYNAMSPGVPAAPAARKAFWQCEKIPQARLASWLVCLGTVYGRAPAKGPQGSAAEATRQQAIADGAGQCTATAKGIKLTASPSPSGTGS